MSVASERRRPKRAGRSEIEGAGREIEGAGREIEGAGREIEGAGREIEGAGREIDAVFRRIMVPVDRFGSNLAATMLALPTTW